MTRHLHSTARRRPIRPSRCAITPRAKRLFESLQPVDQAIIIRCALDLHRPRFATAVDCLSRMMPSRRSWSELLTKDQQREYRNWIRRDRRRRAAEHAERAKGGA